MKREKLVYGLLILSVVFLIIGGTYAAWRWVSNETQRTAVTFTSTSSLSCSADAGGNITSSDVKLAPAECTDPDFAIQRTISTSSTAESAKEIINMDLWLDVNSMDQELLQSDNFKYAVTTNPDSCTSGVVTAGDSFKNKVSNNKAYLFNSQEFIGTENKTYYLYIWLDEAETSTDTMNRSFNLSVNGECSDTGTTFNPVYVNFGGQNAYFKATQYKDNITSISIANNMNIPANAIASWNLGVSPSNADDVKGWLEDDGSGNNTFALKIGAEGQIFARNSMDYAFYNMQNVSSVNLDGLNTSEANSMREMFRYVGNRSTPTFSLDLGANFNTSNVKYMSWMFASTGRRATNFSLNLGNKFNTSNVNNMSSMFHSAGYSATTFNLDLGSQFNTNNVKDMTFMFTYAGQSSTSFSLNLGSQFNTSNVNNMIYMFGYTGQSATSFSLDLGSQFNTGNVINMASMFDSTGQSAMTFNLNLGSQFNTSNVNNMSQMFYYAGQSATSFSINLGNQFNTSNVNDMRFMFSSTGRSTTNNFTLDLAAGDFNNVTSNSSMFSQFPGSKATIYVKDTDAQNFIISQDTSMFNTTNVKIKGQ